MKKNAFFGELRESTPLLLLAACILLISACSDSTNNVIPVGVMPAPDAVVTLGGGVVKGPVAGATINVFAVDNDGQKTGDPIGTATSDGNGTYTIELTNYTGVFIVEATGGSYVDEATGTSKTIPEASPMRAVSSIGSDVGAATATAGITPLTEIATQVSQQKPGGLTADNVTAGNNEVGALFFGSSEDSGTKLLSTVPADITNESSATASDDERLYGLMVGAISQLEANTGSLAEAVATVANDIAADGNLSDSSADLETAANTIIGSPTNNSGVTSATRVTNILRAAASGAGTEIAQSSDADITSFKFDDTLVSTIDGLGNTVSVLQPAGTDTAALTSPSIAISLGATIAPEDGEDFSAPVNYVVTAEDGTTDTWVVTVTVAESDASPLANITAVSHASIGSAVINRNTGVVVGGVSSPDDLVALDQISDPTEIFTVSAGATITSLSGNSYQQGEVGYIVTAEDGTTTKQWSVRFRVNDPQSQPAFSITNADLDLLTTSQTVQLETAGGLAEAVLSFSSSDTSVVTVDTAGNITVAGEGTATVSAKKARLVTPVAEYIAAMDSISVTVSKAEQATLSFALSSVSVPLNGAVSNPLGGGTGTGEVSYSSSDETVATIDANGSVTLVSVGTATISATKAGDATYLESNTASYELTVTEAVTDQVTPTCVLDQSSWDECLIE